MLGRVELHHRLVRIRELPNIISTNVTIAGTIPSSFPAACRLLGYLRKSDEAGIKKQPETSRHMTLPTSC